MDIAGRIEEVLATVVAQGETGRYPPRLAAAIRHGQLSGRIEKIDHHRDGTQRKVAMVDRA